MWNEGRKRSEESVKNFGPITHWREYEFHKFEGRDRTPGGPLNLIQIMKPQEIISTVQNKVSKGARFVGFTYRKDNGETSKRNVLLNVKIGNALKKRGQPLTDTGNWQTGNRLEMANGAIIKIGKQYYLSGFEGGQNLRTFKFEGISELK